MKSCIFVTIRQYQVPVVQKVDCAIHQINLYPLGRAVGFPNNYPLDSDLSGAGCKENHFKAFLFGKLKLAFTSLNIISTTPKNFLTFCLAELISQFFCYSNSSKTITCLSGKLKTEFTSLIAKSTSLWLSDTTLSARCWWIALCSFWTTGTRCNFTLVLVFAFQDYVNCIVKILTDLLLSSSVCCEVYEGSSDMYDETGR